LVDRVTNQFNPMPDDSEERKTSALKEEFKRMYGYLLVPSRVDVGGATVDGPNRSDVYLQLWTEVKERPDLISDPRQLIQLVNDRKRRRRAAGV